MQSIRGTTKLAGVIGKPLAHTLSPAIHNAAYAQLSLDWVYVPLEVPDEAGLRRVVAATGSLPFVGFNVTMPYKQAVMELVDEVSTAAVMAGAVNAVQISEDGRSVGYNTDGRGLIEALEVEADFTPADKDIVVLGAGGAAGAAVVALMLGRASRITVVNRNVEKAEELVERLGRHGGSVLLEVEEPGMARDVVVGADLVLNATPLGMRTGDPSPVPAEWVRPGQVRFDMVYGTSSPTAFVTDGRDAGAVALDGLGMLVAQAAIAIDMWNEGSTVKAPRDLMKKAAEAALDARMGDMEVNDGSGA